MTLGTVTRFYSVDVRIPRRARSNGSDVEEAWGADVNRVLKGKHRGFSELQRHFHVELGIGVWQITAKAAGRSGSNGLHTATHLRRLRQGRICPA